MGHNDGIGMVLFEVTGRLTKMAAGNAVER